MVLDLYHGNLHGVQTKFSTSILFHVKFFQEFSRVCENFTTFLKIQITKKFNWKNKNQILLIRLEVTYPFLNNYNSL